MTPEPIAVVGLAGRFPDSDSPDELWQHLVDGRVCVTDLVPPPGADSGWIGKAYQVREPETFDRHLFQMTAAEVRNTDPQHRLLLTLAHEVLEDAAIDPGRRAIEVGVYVASNLSRLYYQPDAARPADDANALALAVGSDADHLATRIAYRLGLIGPSLTIQSGCSSALTAVHVASQALRAGEIDLALAGGVCLRFPRDEGWVHDPDLIRSVDGYCRPFDSASTGSVPGEGGAIVALKRLSAAVADGDYVYGCLLASAAGNDGAHRAGYLAPGVEGQRRVIQRALDLSGIDARSIGMVEAHGSGTALGDPIEFTALSATYRQAGVDRQACALGSVKSNVGHLNAAAGIVGLVKCLLAVDRGVIPGVPTFEKPSEHIDLQASPFYVPTRSVPWPGPVHRRVAALSSFGLGGANVHALIAHRDHAAGPVAAAATIEDRWPLPPMFPVSAASPRSFQAGAEVVASAIERFDEPVETLSATLTTGRRPLALRGCAIGTSPQQVASALRAIEVPTAATKAPAIAYLLSGPRQEDLSLADKLSRTSQGFRDFRDDCVAALSGSDRHLESSPKLLGFVVQVGVALWLEARGLRPTSLACASGGDSAAFYLGGMLSLPEALALLQDRDAWRVGVSIAIRADLQTVSQLTSDLAEPVDLTGTEVVVVCREADVLVVQGRLARQEIACRQLPGLALWPTSGGRSDVRRAQPGILVLRKATDDLASIADRVALIVDLGGATWAAKSPGNHARLVTAVTESDPLSGVGHVLAAAWEAGAPVDLAAGGNTRARLPGYVYDAECYAAEPVAPTVADATPATAREASVEEQVLTAFEAVMGIRPGADDDVFELGLDSLLAAQIVSRLKDVGFEVRVRDLFEAESARALADQLRARSQL